MVLLLTGALVLSLLGSAPMTGPLAALVTVRALESRKSALLIALGGSVLEGLIAGSLASFLPVLVGFSEMSIDIARYAGSGIILLVGVIMATMPERFEGFGPRGKRASVSAGMLTTALNPTIFATWSVVVTWASGQGWLSGGFIQGGVFGLGVALGSFVWFAMVVWVIARINRNKMISKAAQERLIRIIGFVLSLGSLVLLVRTILTHRAP